MLCISPPMRLLNMPWGVIKLAFIIHLQLVRPGYIHKNFESSQTDRFCLATSGAAATIASDAFMNPFDGVFYIVRRQDCSRAQANTSLQSSSNECRFKTPARCTGQWLIAQSIFIEMRASALSIYLILQHFQ